MKNLTMIKIIVILLVLTVVFFYFKKSNKIDLSQDSAEVDGNSISFGNIYTLGDFPDSDNFKFAEFQSKNGDIMPVSLYGNLQALMNELEIIREHFNNSAITIHSGYRSPAHNSSIGGASKSMHLLAKAADITIKGYTPKEVQAGIKKLMSEGLIYDGGLGVYNSFTHYDIGTSRTWNG